MSIGQNAEDGRREAMGMRSSPLGSIWRQWDLHIHTPSSYDYENKSTTDKAIVDMLVGAGVELVCVTDHHVIDCGRISRLRELSGDRLTILPGIELRSELGSKHRVHFVGIFPEDADIGYIWEKLRGKLDITDGDVKKKGDNCIYVDFAEAARHIHDLGGLVSVHAGRKSNSIEEIPNTERYLQCIKEDLARGCVDLMEVAGPGDVKAYRETVFRKTVFGDSRRGLPLVVCSDSHNARGYEQRCRCWVRADPGFAGLRQVLAEPEDRVFLGDLPPLLARVESHPTKYAKSLAIRKVPGAELDERWFDCELELNPGLIAVIGRKGGGKSALAEVLGLCGDTGHSQAFSFLHDTKFRSKKSNKAKHFEAELTWVSGDTTRRELHSDTAADAVETIKCIPQNYLERICTEVTESEEGEFDEELRSVIFSHVSESDRLRCSSLQELIEHHTSEMRRAIDQVVGGLHRVNEAIVEAETCLTAEHRQKLQNQLAEKRRELEAHEARKPAEVPRPSSEEADGENGPGRRIEAKRQDVATLDAQVAELDAERKALALRASLAEKLLAKLDNLRESVASFEADSSEVLSELGLRLDEVLLFEVRREPVERLRDEAVRRATEISHQLDPSTTEGPVAVRSRLSGDIAELQRELGAAEQSYEDYLEELYDWQLGKQQLVGDTDTAGSVEFLSAKIRELSDLPQRLDELLRSRVELSRRIYGHKQRLAECYRALYRPVQEFIGASSHAREQLEFHVAMQQQRFAEEFLAFINQSRRGTFHGVSGGRAAADAIVARSDFASEEGVLEFLSAIMASLSEGKPDHESAVAAIGSQLGQGRDALALYDYLFSLDFIKPRYVLRWQGKELHELSPGERGTVLLVFYLLVDRSDIPLVIDQPEENLDNQTIYDILVPCIKEARSRRQVIMVTHNPNLAVVCDADQVIHAEIDRTDGNRVTYTSGAIENPDINQRIVDILEGTRPAFDNRKAKYARQAQGLA